MNKLILLLIVLFLPKIHYSQEWECLSFPIDNYNSTASVYGTSKVFYLGTNGHINGNYTGTNSWIFDNYTSKWKQLSSVTSPEISEFPSGHSTYEISYAGNNKILLLIGYNFPYGYDNTETWLFDLLTHEWATLTPDSFPSRRINFDLCYLGNNKVLLFGGLDFDSLDIVNDSWIFDSDSYEWTRVFPQTQPSIRQNHSLTTAGNNKAIMFGGRNHNGYLNDTWIFDLIENKWEKIEPLISPSKRLAQDICYTGDNKILLFGGIDSSGTKDDTWVFDIDSLNWSKINTGFQPETRYSHSLSYLDDGEVLLVGGNGHDSDCWFFNLNDVSWKPYYPVDFNPLSIESVEIIGKDIFIIVVGSNLNYKFWEVDLRDISFNKYDHSFLPMKRYNYSTSYLGSHNLILYGGHDFSEYYYDTWIFNSTNEEWNKLEFQNAPKLGYLELFQYIEENRIAAFGYNDSFQLELWTLNLNDTTWNEFAGELVLPKEMEHYSYIGNNKYITFAYENDKIESWIFDSEENSWSKLNPENTPPFRKDFTTIFMGGDKLLFFGGKDYEKYYSDTWIFDLSENKWFQLEFDLKPESGISEFKSGQNGTFILSGGHGINGFFKDVWQFAYPLNEPELLYPADDSSRVPTKPALSWIESEICPEHRLQVSLSPDFSGLIIDTLLSGNMIEIGSLDYETTYFWRVKGVFNDRSGNWSEVRQFTTISDVPESWEYQEETGRRADILVPLNINPEIFNRNIDIGDAIGFFYDDDGTEKCAGYGKWADSDFNLTVWGDNHQTPEKEGFDENESYVIKIWDARLGMEFYGEAKYRTGTSFFTQDGLSEISSLNAIDTCKQEIVLRQGWNLISSYIYPNNQDMESVWKNLEDLLAIVKDNFGNVYIPEFGINSIGDWSLHAAYKTYVISPAVLEITGHKPSPESEKINLESGWNYIPYLLNREIDINLALSALIDENIIVIVKDDIGNVFIPAFGINTIEEMIPGRGYQIYLSEHAVFNYENK
jgi:hypothetical protein